MAHRNVWPHGDGAQIPHRAAGGLTMWTAPTPDTVDGPLTGADRPILEAYLAWQRTTLLNICAGLSGQQLAARPLASSNLSLLGLVRHMAKRNPA